MSWCGRKDYVNEKFQWPPSEIEHSFFRLVAAVCPHVFKTYFNIILLSPPRHLKWNTICRVALNASQTNFAWILWALKHVIFRPVSTGVAWRHDCKHDNRHRGTRVGLQHWRLTGALSGQCPHLLISASLQTNISPETNRSYKTQRKY